MPVLSKAADYYLTYRFIKTLTTPFEDTQAFELGIIDDEGNILKPMRELRSKEEKKAYGYFERMVWNLKKLITKIPFLGHGFKNVAAASFLLLREESEQKNLKEKTFLKYFYSDIELLMESPTNSVGSQNIAGLEHDPDGPPIKPRKKKKKKKKKRKKFIDFIRM